MQHVAVAALLGALVSGAAHVDQPGQKMDQQHPCDPYAGGEELSDHQEADDGHWEGEAVRRGAKFDFHIDPHSGRITKLERDRD